MANPKPKPKFTAPEEDQEPKLISNRRIAAEKEAKSKAKNNLSMKKNQSENIKLKKQVTYSKMTKEGNEQEQRPLRKRSRTIDAIIEESDEDNVKSAKRSNSRRSSTSKSRSRSKKKHRKRKEPEGPLIEQSLYLKYKGYKQRKRASPLAIKSDSTPKQIEFDQIHFCQVPLTTTHRREGFAQMVVKASLKDRLMAKLKILDVDSSQSEDEPTAKVENESESNVKSDQSNIDVDERLSEIQDLDPSIDDLKEVVGEDGYIPFQTREHLVHECQQSQDKLVDLLETSAHSEAMRIYNESKGMNERFPKEMKHINKDQKTCDDFYIQSKRKWLLTVEGDAGVDLRIAQMLHETKTFSIMDTILAIRKVSSYLAAQRAQLRERVAPKVMNLINEDAMKRGSKCHFFNKAYKVRV